MTWRCSCGFEAGDFDVICAKCGATKPDDRAVRRILAVVPPGPFDPRTEVSADGKHIAGRIVAHLWIIFVLLPFIAMVVYGLIVAAK
jgi:hypothetical protein